MDSRTGELITAAQAEIGVFIWEIQNPLYFKILEHQNRPFLINQDTRTVRIQFNHNLRKALGIHNCFLFYRIWMSSQPQTGRFFWVLKTEVFKYLDNLGIISINNVNRAVDHVLWNVLQHIVYVDQSYSITFNIY
ncbi:transcription enhancer protein [Sunn hemp leaf distortion virus [India:Barrackpore2:2008]]|uniref:Replication enhancer n=1 Tax=Sunn hemp leaf distortion virus TaxID=579113 RepID=B9V4F2_9GEMI|nr:transcription enhancer protein [Sunn hemp leaf distortion virus]ACM62305.1 transcription enhancer protein [Sunn hemp leaf distortion virus]ACS92544.1 transcription enhancer protein [Sunn hemp leaf distortion virus [India:Barrackpore2:2008]]ACS92550.1 transcription enhancer protein [Sunn hemp leaf distortion virus [India:Barrackpore3:2008]]